MSSEVGSLLEKHAVVVFSKTTDPYSCKAKRLITHAGYKFKCIELDELDAKEKDQMESALKSMSSGAASPYVFIGKKYIGDSKEILVLSQQDKLKELLGAAGAAEHPKPPHVLKK